MDGFETGDIGVGVVTGIRRWALTDDGGLMAMSWPYVWTQGENVAEHAADVNMSPCTCPGCRAELSDCADLSCGDCGFYGYFNDRAQYQSGGVEGVIEGYGYVIIGTRGFRAQRARIVALAPTEDAPADLVALMRQRYPEIPVHATTAEMLAEYPTDQVDMPPDEPVWNAPIFAFWPSITSSLAMKATFDQAIQSMLDLTVASNVWLSSWTLLDETWNFRPIEAEAKPKPTVRPGSRLGLVEIPTPDEAIGTVVETVTGRYTGETAGAASWSTAVLEAAGRPYIEPLDAPRWEFRPTPAQVRTGPPRPRLDRRRA